MTRAGDPGSETARGLSEARGAGPCAVAWSGGKDSTLALHRALREGLEVTHLLNVYDSETDRVGFHGVRRRLLGAQAGALGLELIQEPAPEGEFEGAFGRALERTADAGIESLVFGNIHLQDVRSWYEERTRSRGLHHVEPLWGGEPGRLAREFVRLGYRARVVAVMLDGGDPAWLGRDLDLEFLGEVEARGGVDPCGERGEFHSFVWDGPLFREPVPVRSGGSRDLKGHRFLELREE